MELPDNAYVSFALAEAARLAEGTETWIQLDNLPPIKVRIVKAIERVGVDEDGNPTTFLDVEMEKA